MTVCCNCLLGASHFPSEHHSAEPHANQDARSPTGKHNRLERKTGTREHSARARAEASREKEKTPEMKELQWLAHGEGIARPTGVTPKRRGSRIERLDPDDEEHTHNAKDENRKGDLPHRKARVDAGSVRGEHTTYQGYENKGTADVQPSVHVRLTPQLSGGATTCPARRVCIMK
jgi:hypothetical protein